MPKQKEESQKHSHKKSSRKHSHSGKSKGSHKHKQKHHKHHKDRSSRSRSRSAQSSSPSSRSSSSSRSSRPDQKRQRQHRSERERTEQIVARQFRMLPPKGKINAYALSNIICSQKKMNTKLDLDETSRAASMFKQKFNEEIKPVTMSAFLSNESLMKEVEIKHDGGVLLCTLCNRHFEAKEDLVDHLERHE